MKKIVVNGFLLLLSFGHAACSPCTAQAHAIVDSSYMNQQYKLRLDFFTAMPNRKKEIVFVGNSLTEGGKWQELLQVNHVVNRGISGDVTYGILARLEEILTARPRKIFLLCGINDMKRGIPNATILRNIERIIMRVKLESPRTVLYVQSLLPVNEEMLPTSYKELNNPKIKAFNNLLKQICREKKVTYIDLYPIFADSQGRMKRELSIDGLHLWQVSYILWGDYLKKIKVI